MPNYFQIGAESFDIKIFKVLYVYIYLHKNSPHLTSMLLCFFVVVFFFLGGGWLLFYFSLI